MFAWVFCDCCLRETSGQQFVACHEGYVVEEVGEEALSKGQEHSWVILAVLVVDRGCLGEGSPCLFLLGWRMKKAGIAVGE